MRIIVLVLVLFYGKFSEVLCIDCVSAYSLKEILHKRDKAFQTNFRVHLISTPNHQTLTSANSFWIFLSSWTFNAPVNLSVAKRDGNFPCFSHLGDQIFHDSFLRLINRREWKLLIPFGDFVIKYFAVAKVFWVCEQLLLFLKKGDAILSQTNFGEDAVGV